MAGSWGAPSLTLCRQSASGTATRQPLETSTISGWVGATAAALTPLVDTLAADIIGSDTLHVHGTVPVLAWCSSAPPGRRRLNRNSWELVEQTPGKTM